MLITPNLGLTAWNASTDNFNHVQLTQNWVQLDQHDHSPGKGTQINGATGIVPASITGTQIASATITDGNLVSSNNAVKRLLAKSLGIVSGQTFSTSGQTFIIGTGGLIASGTSISGNNVPAWWLPDQGSEFAVNGKTFYGSVRVTVMTNTVAPNWNISAGAVQLSSVAGTSGAMIYNFISIAGSNSSTSTNTAASTVTPLVTTTGFTMPTGLPVAPSITLSGGTGTQAANSAVYVGASLWGYWA